MKISLKTGLLEIKNNSNENELNNLISYSSRINKKRGYFFVSNVLGKHIPTKPSVMLNIYQKMANLIPHSIDNTLFIGFAEAATGLGQGVYENYLQHSFGTYIHSSRFKTSKDILFEFQEEHSHAKKHIFYKPQDFKLDEVKRIVLIDDEITTGTTVRNIIKQLKKTFLYVDEYLILSIVNWSENSNNIKSLINGSFSFENNSIIITDQFMSEPLETKSLDDILPIYSARYGIKKMDIDISKYIDINKYHNQKVLVIGTAEFVYIPYLLAKYLEDENINVMMQSTTRSPLNIDGVITSRLIFKDNYHENIDNFLYNVIDKDYDICIICYETREKPKKFNLLEQLQDKFIVEEIYFNV